MRLNKWIVAGLLAGGFAFTGVQRAQAFMANDLYGNWTGTVTPRTSPAPTEIVKGTAGITDYPTPSSFFTPGSETLTFAPSGDFAFGIDDTDAGIRSPTTGLINEGFQQTGAQVSGNTFTWDVTYILPLSNGGTLDVLAAVDTGTIKLDPTNSNLLLLTGTEMGTFLVDELPSNSEFGTAVNSVSDFSVTKAIMSEPSGVPLPPAAWSGLALLSGLAVVGTARSRLRGAHQ
jgi:hypothetical protein